MKPRTPVGPVACLEDSLDLPRQSLVLPASTARLATQPCVVPRPGYSMAPAERLYAKSVPFRLDKGEDRCLCAEQNRMAFFRISCSSRSNAYRRLSSEYASTRRCSL